MAQLMGYSKIHFLPQGVPRGWNDLWGEWFCQKPIVYGGKYWSFPGGRILTVLDGTKESGSPQGCIPICWNSPTSACTLASPLTSHGRRSRWNSWWWRGTACRSLRRFLIVSAQERAITRPASQLPRLQWSRHFEKPVEAPGSAECNCKRSRMRKNV